MMECAKEMEITMEKVQEMVDSGATIDTSCFIACCFKKAGLVSTNFACLELFCYVAYSVAKSLLIS